MNLSFIIAVVRNSHCDLFNPSDEPMVDKLEEDKFNSAITANLENGPDAGRGMDKDTIAANMPSIQNLGHQVTPE